MGTDSETGLYDGVAYASQLPWLQHDSIKNNVLFGAPFEKDRYDEVIRECALGADLKLFDAGDETGKNLGLNLRPLSGSLGTSLLMRVARRNR